MTAPLARVLPLVCLSGLLTGCLSTGSLLPPSQTDDRLADGPFRLVATDVGGEASAFYLFGFSTGGSTAALVRVSGGGDLRARALAGLWRRFEQEHGAVEGRRLALVNVRADAQALNVLFATRPKVSIRADVVEFDAPADTSLSPDPPLDTLALAAMPAAGADVAAATDSTAFTAVAAEEAPGGGLREGLYGNEVLELNRGGYTWIVASAFDVDAANEMAHFYREKGFRCDVLTGVYPKGDTAHRVYRVAVGHFLSLDAAEAARAELPADVPQDAWILRLK